MKYIGSKSRIAKELIEIIQPSKYNYYIEPFVGGANVIDKVQCNNRVGYDSNYYLIAFLNKLKTDWKLPYLSKEQYEDIKANKKDYSDYLVGYAGIAASYCGKWFDSYAGKYTRPDRNNYVEDYMQQSINAINRQRKKLLDVEFYHADYSQITIPYNSVIYCDPPYANLNHYQQDFDSDKFWDWVRDLSQYHKIYVSEYSAPDDFVCVWEQSLTSYLSATSNKKTSIEKLWSYNET